MPLDFNAIKEKWKEAWKTANVGEVSVDPSKPKFFLIWAYLTVSGFHHVGHMRGYSYADAICRYKRMRGFNVLLTAGGHASGNSAVAKAKKVAEGDVATINDYKEMGLTTTDLSRISTPEGFVDFFAERYIRDYDDYGYIGDWRRFTVTTYPDYNKFIEWQFHKLKENNLLVQKPYYATWCDSCGAVAVDPSESDISKGGNAQKTEFTLIKLAVVKNGIASKNEYVVVATLRPETMYGQTNVWVDYNITYAKVSVPAVLAPAAGNEEIWIVSEQCADKLQHQIDGVKIVGKISGKELVGTSVIAPLANRAIPIIPSKFCDPDIGTGIVTSVPSDSPADWMGLHDLQINEAECKKFGLNFADIKAIKLIPIIQTKGFGTLPAVELCEKLGITSQNDSEKLEIAKQELYKKGFHTGVMLETCGPYAGLSVMEAKEQIKQTLINEHLATMFYDLSEEVLSRYGDRVYIKRVDDQWFIKYSDETLTQKTIAHVESMQILPEQFKQNLPGILNWFEDRACARQGRWLGTKLPFDQSYTIEPIADSTLYPIYYLVSLYVNQKKISVDQLTPQFFDFIYLGEGNAAAVSKAIGVSEALLKQIRADVEYWYPLDMNLGGKEHQTVHFPVYLMNHVGILPPKYYPKGIFVNWWVVGNAGAKISKSKGGVKSIADEAKIYSVDAIRLYYANIASPFVDIGFESDDLAKYKSRLERIHELFEQIKAMRSVVAATALENSENGANTRLDEWLMSQWHTHLSAIVANMDIYEFKAASDVIYFGMYADLQWYIRRGGNNAAVCTTIAKEWSLAMGFFTPYLAEELNAILGEKMLVLQSRLPAVDKTKINPAFGAIEDMIKQTNQDIAKVKEFAKLSALKKVTLIVSRKWKYDFFRQFKVAFSETKDIGKLMRQFTATFPQQKSEVSALIPKLLKTGTIPEVHNSALVEHTALLDAVTFFRQNHGDAIEFAVLYADDSTHPKAAQAIPGKPAIVVE